MTDPVGLQFDTEIRTASDSNAIGQAKSLLVKEQLVTIPTETVYGLAANAFSKEAVARIFAVKGRPSNNPLIVHVSSVEMAKECVSTWPDVASSLAEKFWPGPLSMVLAKAEKIPDIEQPAVRQLQCVAHPIR